MQRLERQCLERKRLILPPDHADFPVIMNNLAVALFYQGQLTFDTVSSCS
jgi:hypothetical protein